MNFVPLVLVSVIGGSILTLGNYVKVQAVDVVVKADLVTLSKALTSYEIFNNKYPESFEELVKEEGISDIGENYIYQRSENGREAAVLGVSDNKLYCWESEGMMVEEITQKEECHVGHPGFEPGTSTLN